MPIPNGGSAAVAAAARDGVPPPSRFAHLLQPIRDVAANWAVDVAAELEAYLTDIEAAEAALSATDFTTAALLVQGSAGVYARKVEHLYSLVFRALDLVRAHADGGGGGAPTVPAGTATTAVAARGLVVTVVPRGTCTTWRWSGRLSTSTCHRRGTASTCRRPSR